MRILRKGIKKSSGLFFQLIAYSKLKLNCFIDLINVLPLLQFLLIANLLDAFLTLKWLELRVADEANPLMALLIEISPSLFLFTKVSAISISCLILWKYRTHTLAKLSALLGALVYYIILLYHLFGALRENILVIPTKEQAVIAAQEWWVSISHWLSALFF